MSDAYDFDRFLRYDELVTWLDELADAHPELVSIETYGQSHEGRDLLIATVTDPSTGAHDTKPAHWVDANIHSVELTASVAACRLLRHLVDGFHQGGAFEGVPLVGCHGGGMICGFGPRYNRDRW